MKAKFHKGGARGAATLRHLGGIKNDVRREYGIYPTMVRRLGDRQVRSDLLADLMLVMLISLAFASFCISKDGGLDMYMSSFLPMLGVVTGFFVVTETLRGSRVICFGTSTLILAGMAIQIILKITAGNSDELSADDLIQYAVISLVFALAVLPILRYMCSDKVNRGGVVFFLNITIVMLYLALLALGRTINSTRAWICIGGFQFQMTEPIKCISLMTMALAFMDKSKTHDERLINATITLILNAMFLVVINEFGTLFILGLTFFFLALGFQPQLKKLAMVTGVLILAAALILLVCYGCYVYRYGPPHAAETAETEVVEEVTEAPTEAPTEAEAETDAEAEEEESIIDKITSLGAKIYNKFSDRVDIFFHPENVDPNKEGYQAKKANEALVLSNWLGSAAEVSIPVAESDYVFCYLILKMGVLFGLAILVILLAMLLQGVLTGLANTTGAEGAVAVAFIFAIVAQSLIAAASSTGYFMTIGLPFPFLASGGSATLVNYTMIVFVLYATRQRSLAPAGECPRKE